MTAPALKNPAHFKIRGADAILARHGNLFVGVGFSILDNAEAEALFERGDEQIEAHAAEHGYAGDWITPDEARELRDRENCLLACQPGDYPWDDWQRDALAAGVPDELANLGRAVMREAYQHAWCESLKYECGVGHTDSATGMVLEAKECPDRCRSRWEWLLATDGLRCDPWDHREMSPRDISWTELRHRWENENHPIEDRGSEATFRRSAYREIEEAYRLDQLAIISLGNQAFHRSGEVTAFYAEFAVIVTERGDRFHPHIPHQGIVQVRFDPERSEHFDVDVFERRDECAERP